ncbi:FxLD family lanthipeptide [Yinghuangia sp. YIM S10712]|uniref:FxLD family lanthipeptide n=1 Tax=Yinghuangia sp. YIM S10712 TaxID=3436930 RepID=UPI003F52CE17
MSNSTAERTVASPPVLVDPADPEFTLDVAVLEIEDPQGLITMTDDNCGSSCSKTTCVTSS